MKTKRIKLNTDEFKELSDIVFTGEKYKLNMHYCAGRESIKLDNLEGTTIVITSDFRTELVLKNIELINKRIGTGTKILNWLKEYGKNKGFSNLKVESVITEEMYSLCTKEGFTFVPFWSMGKYQRTGNFYFVLNEEEFIRDNAFADLVLSSQSCRDEKS